MGTNHILGAVLGDPVQLLARFKTAIQKLEAKVDPGRIEKAKRVLAIPEPLDLTELSLTNRFAYRVYLEVKDLPLHPIGYPLFLSILQSYTLPPTLRKRVEMGSREYAKSRAPSLPSKNKYLSALLIYEKTLAQARQYAETATEAIRVGKPHVEGATQIQVGPFRLLNMGGFSPETVAGAVEILEDAVQRVKRAGFEKVLYGDIHLTNTLMSRTLAFYLRKEDELFLRANLPLNKEVALSFIHELGHRYEDKFLRRRSYALESLYEKIESNPLPEEVFDPPQPGEELVDKGVVYEVVHTKPNPMGEMKIVLRRKDLSNTLRMQISLQGWRQRKGLPLPPQHSFVTPYAKTSPEENFAEMFAYFVMGSLPPNLIPLFEETLAI